MQITEGVFAQTGPGAGGNLDAKDALNRRCMPSYNEEFPLNGVSTIRYATPTGSVFRRAPLE